MNHIQPIDLYQNKRIEIENLYPIRSSNYVHVIFDKSKRQISSIVFLSFILITSK